MSKKIEAPDGYAAGRDIHSTAAPAVSIQGISGGTNVIGTQGDVSIQLNQPAATRPRIVVQPGPQHISEEQKAKLKDLCDQWVALHALMKKKPLSYGAAWGKINRAAGTTSYSLILKERFDDAVRLVQKEMAILRNMRSAPRKDPSSRGSRISAIKARSKNQLGDPDFYKPYIKKNFGAESLTDLSTDELQKTYAYVMAKRM